MSAELPFNWTTATIGEVSDYVSRGKSPKYTEKSSLPVINQKAIRWFGIQDEHLKYIDPQQFEAWSEERYIKEGDILWNSTGTGTIGRACLVKENNLKPPKVVDSHVTIVRPNKDCIDPRYLFSWIRGPSIQKSIIDLSSGSTNQIELNRSSIVATEVPLAPINEQKRIADKLDNLLGRVDACREHLDRVPQILKRFRQSVLLAAFNGLFTDNLATSVHSSNWHRFRIEGIAEVIFDGPFGSNLKSDDYTESGARVIRLENIGHLKFNDDKRTYISMEKYVYLNRHTIYPGDILFSSFVDEEVRVCVYRNKWPEVAINKADCFCIRTNRDLCDPEYLAYALACHSTYEIIKESVHGATRPRINLRQLKDFEVALPPLPVQKLIVQKISSLFQFADDFEARHAAALEIIERLTPSTLDKAFRGELVPQDPNDEPASNLLERIKGAMPGAKTTIRRKRSPRESEMKPMSTKSIREIIAEIPEGQFSFDEIRNKCGSDYESVKSEIFKLLSEKNPILKQSFDAKNKTMVFVRTKQ